MAEEDNSKNKFLIIIAGPTAVGKSSIALQLAKVFNSAIFSADSRQVYKEMNIGTAKPSVSELESVVHYGIDSRSIDDLYNVGQFVDDMHESLADYFKRQDVALLVGGTGMYIQSLLNGIDYFPDVRKEILDDVEKSYLAKGIEYLQSELQIKDIDYYSVVDIHNPQRLIRALSVIKETGKPFSSYLTSREAYVFPYQTIEILIESDRESLYQDINDRVDQMINKGLIEEARLLYPFRDRQALATVGYSELFSYFDGDLSLDRALELIKQNSRRYAKRQLTWFRKHGNWNVFKKEQLVEIIDFINKEINQLKDLGS